ncbi:hypothetical protein [Streptomyces sp. A1136]|uniref:hypothetical protein n=1 Tax=Streptomyces sp. A1136 TaxID=2563102 RepID=UPI00109E7FE7|nr:hypothetical protein [Streptomyces sp. A1136]THA44506.1 hypothetical protein E6R62_36850 [Streptomyces sp. A1136]
MPDHAPVDAIFERPQRRRRVLILAVVGAVCAGAGYALGVATAPDGASQPPGMHACGVTGAMCPDAPAAPSRQQEQGQHCGWKQPPPVWVPGGAEQRDRYGNIIAGSSGGHFQQQPQQWTCG